MPEFGKPHQEAKRRKHQSLAGKEPPARARIHGVTMFEVGQTIQLFGKPYKFACMPGTPDIVFGMTGRAGTVYKLDTPEGRGWALKSFNPIYRDPGQVRLGQELEALANLPGLRVCRRQVLTPQNHRQLLRDMPDLVYSVLMPWVDGQTWTEVISGQNDVSQSMVLRLARTLAETLSQLEQQSIAHCDLAGGNLIVEKWTEEQAVLSLVDLEEICARHLQRPVHVPAGSPGYGPGQIKDSLWCPEADRLSAAILISEMLCWCDPKIRQISQAESYFSDLEVQQDCDRYRRLHSTLSEIWGRKLASLLQQAWEARSLMECPNLGEWSLLMPDKPPSPMTISLASRPAAPLIDTSGPEALVGRAKQHLSHGRLDIARELFESALYLLPHDHVLAHEVESHLKSCTGSAQSVPAVAKVERGALGSGDTKSEPRLGNGRRSNSNAVNLTEAGRQVDQGKSKLAAGCLEEAIRAFEAALNQLPHDHVLTLEAEALLQRCKSAQAPEQPPPTLDPSPVIPAPSNAGKLIVALALLAVILAGSLGYRRWSQRPGSLIVTANVAGATVIVDGQKLGQLNMAGDTAQFELATLSMGQHQVQLELPHYSVKPQDVAIEAGARARLNFSLEPLPVAVQFHLRPTSMSFQLDQNPARELKDGDKLQLKPGFYDYIASATGYTEQRNKFEVPSGIDSYEQKYELKLAQHAVEIIPSVYPVTITVSHAKSKEIIKKEKVLKGSTFRCQLLPGEYKVIATGKEGYDPASDKVSVALAAPPLTTIPLALKKKPAVEQPVVQSESDSSSYTTYTRARTDPVIIHGNSGRKYRVH